MNTKYYIRRPINGISLNGFEFISEPGSDKPILFDSEDAAKVFLINAGYNANTLAHDLNNGAIDIDIWNNNEN